MGVPFILGLKHTERIWPNHEETGTPFQTTWDYDLSNGFLTSKTGDGFTTTFTPFEDDEANKGNVRSSRRGNDLEKTILYEYSWGRVSRIQTPFVDTTREINPDGTVHAESVIGRTTTYSYDALGRLTSVQPPGSSRAPTITDYNQNGATVTITRDSSVVTTTLDGFGRPIETVVNGVNLDIRTRTAYDAEGRKTYEGLPFKSGEGDGDVGTKFEYDGLGRVTLERMIRSVDQNSGPTRTRTYSGNVVIVRDENNHLTELTNVAYGDPDQPLLAAVRDANGNAWSYTYTHMGSLQSVVGPGATLLSPTTRLWGYNAHNQIIGEQHPESGIVSYDNYDSGGMLKEKSDQINTFEYGYDANYRLAQVLVGGQMVKGFTFEPGTDNIKTTISPEVLTTYGFEPDTGRISSRTDSVDAISFKVEYTYDARDNVSTIKYPSGRLIQYAYDSANRITSVVNPILGASGTLASNLQYHPSGGLKSYTAGNNVLTTVGYDARRYWVNSVVVAGAGGFNISYGHDGAGNVLTITDQRSNWGNQTFTYDNLDRLATAQGAYGSMTLNYDVFGNRQATNYTYDPNNPFKLTAIDNLGMAYDNNGNLKTGPQAQFDYNTSNLISRAIVGGTTTNYAYDGDDWRVKKVVGTGAPTYYIRGANGQLLSEWKNSSPAQVKDYVYAGSRLIAIYETTLAQKTQ
jgi:YD repeat-containing protein